MFDFKPNTTVGYVADDKEHILTYLRSLFVKDDIYRDAKLGRVHTFRLMTGWECRIYEFDGDNQEDFREFTLHGQGYDELFIEPYPGSRMVVDTVIELKSRLKKKEEL